MDTFVCDYMCRTVGESINKYNIPDHWSAEFDAYDDIYPIIAIPVEQIRKSSAIMDMKLRFIKCPDDEYAGCIVCFDEEIIMFKIDHMSDLVQRIGNAVNGPVY